jgi:HlyD family secretion protein
MTHGIGRLVGAAAIVCVLGGFALHAAWSDRESPAIAGLVQRTRLRVAPEITGRLALVTVKRGQAVHSGDTLAVLENPELAATLGEARATAARAIADRDHVFAGVRPEEVAIAARAIATAEANLLLARQVYARAAALAGQGFASRQRLDEATAQLDKAQADLAARRADHVAAQAGPTSQERALAEARVAQAQAAVRSIAARLDKIHLAAPEDATVGTLAGAPGEILPPGRPVLTLDLDDEIFFAFTIREDRLRGFDIDARRDLLDASGRHIPARVTEIRPLGEFATWRAARAVGDHDLNSFRVRFEPLTPISGLEPGMTVWLSSDAKAGG